MRTFIVACCGYGGIQDIKDKTMETVEAKDFRDLLWKIHFKCDKSGFKYDLVKEFEMENGEGQPYFIIKELIYGKIEEVDELIQEYSPRINPAAVPDLFKSLRDLVRVIDDRAINISTTRAKQALKWAREKK